ncbi:VOC family protein [Nonomuraea sp. B12E4]|uniref:VOC family protein n=1 Tax=Nonomuraea sp. B12E4 TaxID=3153564 RepID=UPI00325F6CE3
MRMLHLGLRVTDLERSLAFYTSIGYAELGSVPETGFGSLTMLQLPDDPFVSLELVHDPARPVKDTGAVNHLVIQVDDLDATITDLAAKGITAEPPAEPGPGPSGSGRCWPRRAGTRRPGERRGRPWPTPNACPSATRVAPSF